MIVARVRDVVALVLALAAGQATAPPCADGQVPAGVRVLSGVAPAEVTVGDPFMVRVQVEVPRGAVVEFVEEVGASDALQSLAPVQVLPGDEGEPFVAEYALVAWHAGEIVRPVVPVFVRMADGVEHTLRVTLPSPTVRSVLPADTAGIEPRPARGIVAADARFSWWWVILAVLLLGLAVLALYRLRSPRGPPEPMAATSPRQRAIAEMENARSAGLVEAGEWKPYYSRVGDALRGYLSSLSPGWGTDLTTEELLRAVRADGAGYEEARDLEAVLGEADLVKFARSEPDRGDAERFWVEARRLVDALEPAVRPHDGGTAGATAHRPQRGSTQHAGGQR